MHRRRNGSFGKTFRTHPSSLTRQGEGPRLEFFPRLPQILKYPLPHSLCFNPQVVNEGCKGPAGAAWGPLLSPSLRVQCLFGSGGSSGRGSHSSRRRNQTLPVLASTVPGVPDQAPPTDRRTHTPWSPGSLVPQTPVWEVSPRCSRLEGDKPRNASPGSWDGRRTAVPAGVGRPQHLAGHPSVSAGGERFRGHPRPMQISSEALGSPEEGTRARGGAFPFPVVLLRRFLSVGEDRDASCLVPGVSPSWEVQVGAQYTAPGLGGGPGEA